MTQEGTAACVGMLFVSAGVGAAVGSLVCYLMGRRWVRAGVLFVLGLPIGTCLGWTAFQAIDGLMPIAESNAGIPIIHFFGSVAAAAAVGAVVPLIGGYLIRRAEGARSPGRGERGGMRG